MYTIYKYPEGITLNPREYALDEKDEVIKFKTTDEAVKYLLPHFDFVEMLEQCGIHIEEEEDEGEEHLRYMNTKKAYEIYEKQGQDGVLAAVHQGKLKIDKWGFCEPCEYNSPIYQDCCLVCGESMQEEADA